MFATVDAVKRITDYDVDEDLIARAQYIIESYIGRTEVQVLDPFDMANLELATAFQAAYMLNDGIKIYEQMSVAQVSQFGAGITFKADDTVSPWLAPLAIMACKRLSWNRSRSVRTSTIYDDPQPTTSEWVRD
jgi:hypothetical protein